MSPILQCTINLITNVRARSIRILFSQHASTRFLAVAIFGVICFVPIIIINRENLTGHFQMLAVGFIFLVIIVVAVWPYPAVVNVAIVVGVVATHVPMCCDTVFNEAMSKEPSTLVVHVVTLLFWTGFAYYITKNFKVVCICVLFMLIDSFIGLAASDVPSSIYQRSTKWEVPDSMKPTLIAVLVLLTSATLLSISDPLSSKKGFFRMLFQKSDFASVVPVTDVPESCLGAQTDLTDVECLASCVSCNSGGLESNTMDIVMSHADQQQAISSRCPPFVKVDALQAISSHGAPFIKDVELQAGSAGVLSPTPSTSAEISTEADARAGALVDDDSIFSNLTSEGTFCSLTISSFSEGTRHGISELADDCYSEASKTGVFSEPSHGVPTSFVDKGIQSDLMWNGHLLICSRCAQPPRHRETLDGKWQLCPLPRGFPQWIQCLVIRGSVVECADGKLLKLQRDADGNALLSRGRLSLLPNGMMQRASPSTGATSTFVRIPEDLQPGYIPRQFGIRERADEAPHTSMDDHEFRSCRDTAIQTSMPVLYMCICDARRIDLYDGIWHFQRSSGKRLSKHTRFGLKTLWIRGVTIKDGNGKTFIGHTCETNIKFAYGTLESKVPGVAVLHGEGRVVEYRRFDTRSLPSSLAQNAESSSSSSSLVSSAAISGPDGDITETVEEVFSRTSSFETLDV